MHRAKLVISAQPCTACQITSDLDAESLERVKRERRDFDFEVLLVAHPRELARVEGLEVEALPAVILDGEQISAGTVVTPRQVLGLLGEAEAETK